MTFLTVTQFHTCDPNEFVHQMRSVAPPFHVVPAERGFRARVKMFPLPRVGLFVSKIECGEVVAERLKHTYSINIPLSSGIDRIAGRQRREVPVGDAWVVPEEVELHLRFRTGAPLLVVNIDADLVNAYSGEIAPCVRQPLSISLSTAEGARLFQLLTIHWSEALHGEHAADSLVAIEEVQQSIVEAFVAAVWPEVSTMTASSDARRTIARAKDYIRGELAGSLSVAAIAKTARTTARTLHRVFLDYTGLSPMAYVRRERLNAVRRRLLGADRGEVTVAEAAREHGFTHMGRFSATYRAAFRELPSETLVS
ncbi:MAG: helix-turn-helix domain-containing protein [Deltaproteobacteria bacterium]|nr:helix-turn-helix domain-containing protein [Deltaproteobacteria bacterium]